MEGLWFEEFDLQAWEVIVGHLHRMAKQFKTTHPGRMVDVEISLTGWGGESKPMFVQWCQSGKVMLKLMEDANVVVMGKADLVMM